MTTEKALGILQSVYDEMNSMTEEELYNNMYKNSPTFRSIVDTADEMLRSLSIILEAQNKQIIDSFSDRLNLPPFYEPVKDITEIEISSEGSTCLTAA